MLIGKKRILTTRLMTNSTTLPVK